MSNGFIGVPFISFYKCVLVSHVFLSSFFFYPSSSFVFRKPEGYHQRSLNQITSFNHHARSNLSAHHSSGHHQFLHCWSSTRFSITFRNKYTSESELFLPSFESDIFSLFFSFLSLWFVSKLIPYHMESKMILQINLQLP